MAIKKRDVGTKKFKPRYFFAKHKDYVMALYENYNNQVMINAYDLKGDLVSYGTEPKNKVEKVIANLIQISPKEFSMVMRRRKLAK